MLYWKRCKRCKNWFDIGTNMDLCPECRRYSFGRAETTRRKKRKWNY